MTVARTVNLTAGPFAGNGSNKTFPFGFPVLPDSTVRVWQRVVSTDTITELTSPADYSVVGNNVVTVAAPPVGTELVVWAVYKEEQLTDLIGQGRFYPEIHEDAFDHAVLLLKQLRRDFDKLVPNTGDPWTAPSLDVGGLTVNGVDFVVSLNAAIAAAAGSATAAAGSATAAAGSATAAAGSATAAAGSATAAAGSAQSAEDWATKTSGTVDGTEYSAKKYAQDAQAAASSLSMPVIGAGDQYKRVMVDPTSSQYVLGDQVTQVSKTCGAGQNFATLAEAITWASNLTGMGPGGTQVRVTIFCYSVGGSQTISTLTAPWLHLVFLGNTLPQLHIHESVLGGITINTPATQNVLEIDGSTVGYLLFPNGTAGLAPPIITVTDKSVVRTIRAGDGFTFHTTFAVISDSKVTLEIENITYSPVSAVPMLILTRGADVDIVPLYIGGSITNDASAPGLIAQLYASHLRLENVTLSSPVLPFAVILSGASRLSLYNSDAICNVPSNTITDNGLCMGS